MEYADFQAEGQAEQEQEGQYNAEQENNDKVTISKEEYEILKRDSESLKEVNYLD